MGKIAPEFETQGLVGHRNDPATKGARTVAQQAYEQSKAIDASPEEVFAWLSDVGNLPKYLPPVVDSSVEGPSAEGVPARGSGRRSSIRARAGVPSTPWATWQCPSESAEWSGARRPDVTTRGGSLSPTMAKGAARWWCTSPSARAPRGRRSRNNHPRAETSWRRVSRLRWRASVGNWREVRA